jgi:hypothetical protein
MISKSLSFVKYGDWKPVDAPVLPALPKAKKRPERFPVPALVLPACWILNFSFLLSEFQLLHWWPTVRSVHDARAGHGPVALTGAAAHRADTHLIHRAGRSCQNNSGQNLEGGVSSPLTFLCVAYGPFCITDSEAGMFCGR